MWFAHLRYAELVHRHLPSELDPAEMAWGALVCDADKVAPVSRLESHYVGLERPLEPEPFLRRLRLAAAEARRHRAFLAGVLCHLAADDAWYGYFDPLRQRHPRRTAGWSADSLRALNLQLDLSMRAELQMGWSQLADVDLSLFQRFVPPGVARALRRAAELYLRWDGSLESMPDDPAARAWAASFERLLQREGPRLERFLEVADRSALDRAVLDSSLDAIGRFLHVLEGEEGR